MSTRAIYSFTDHTTNKTNYYYRHHDGYPHGRSGALKRIESILTLEQNFDGINTLMEAIGGERLRDYEDFITSDHQHRYEVYFKTDGWRSSRVFHLLHKDDDTTLQHKYKLDFQNGDETFLSL